MAESPQIGTVDAQLRYGKVLTTDPISNQMSGCRSREDPLHEDVGGEPAAPFLLQLGQGFPHVLAIYVVP